MMVSGGVDEVMIMLMIHSFYGGRDIKTCTDVASFTSLVVRRVEFSSVSDDFPT